MLKTEIEIIFGFSLYTTFLQVVLVTYLKRGLDELSGLELPEDGKVYYY